MLTTSLSNVLIGSACLRVRVCGRGRGERIEGGGVVLISTKSNEFITSRG